MGALEMIEIVKATVQFGALGIVAYIVIYFTRVTIPRTQKDFRDTMRMAEEAHERNVQRITETFKEALDAQLIGAKIEMQEQRHMLLNIFNAVILKDKLVEIETEKKRAEAVAGPK